MSQTWRIRVYWSEEDPPVEHGPFTRDEVREFMYANFSEEQAISAVHVTRSSLLGRRSPVPKTKGGKEKRGV